jgi:hypothetical protein
MVLASTRLRGAPVTASPPEIRRRVCSSLKEGRSRGRFCFSVRFVDVDGTRSIQRGVPPQVRRVDTRELHKIKQDRSNFGLCVPGDGVGVALRWRFCVGLPRCAGGGRRRGHYRVLLWQSSGQEQALLRRAPALPLKTGGASDLTFPASTLFDPKRTFDVDFPAGLTVNEPARRRQFLIAAAKHRHPAIGARARG